MQRAILLGLTLVVITLVAARETSAVTVPGVNGKIAFFGDRDEHGNLDIYVMDANGSKVQRLTTDPAEDAWPKWSPDRSKITFVSNRNTGISSYEILVMDADGSDQVMLAGPEVGIPGWSPDGTRIAFTRRVGDDYEVFVMNPDGTGMLNLSNSPATWDAHPDWSPDGSKIIYTRFSSDSSSPDLFVMNSDGTNQTQLTSSSHPEQGAHYSPDGTKIVFDDGCNDIYVINSDGSGMARVSGEFTQDCSPSWSPDGTKIVFDSDSGAPQGDRDIFVMNADGTGKFDLSDSRAQDTGPDWQSVPPPTPTPTVPSPTPTPTVTPRPVGGPGFEPKHHGTSAWLWLIPLSISAIAVGTAALATRRLR